MKSMSFHTAGLLADSINDASSTRKVYLLAAGLALLGIALIMVTVWFWRSTHHDPELLAPLEVMGARRFRRLDGGSQQQMLNRSRPTDAKPMRWGVVRGEASGESEVDLTEIVRNAPGDFDDLRDPALIAVAVQETSDDVSGELPVVAAPDVDARSGAAIDPLTDIDSALAAAGARIDGVPLAAAVAPPIVSDGLVAEPAVSESVERAEGAVEDASLVAPAEAPALVIVPVDHELRKSPPRRVRAEPQPRPEPVLADATTAAVLPDEPDEPVSIDPLLRMFNRNDG